MAILDDIIYRNPTKGVTTPKPGKVERYVLSPEECHALISATQENYKPLIHIALATGLRFQELRDLKISDFDAQTKTLAVRSSKTAAGIRSIMLSDSEAALIDSYLHKRAPGAREGDSPLFTSPEGLAIHYRNFMQRVFKKTKDAAGLKRIRFHDLRRTHATILVAADTNQKVVQERLGHQNISTTLALYAQGTPRSHSEASRATETYLTII